MGKLDGRVAIVTGAGSGIGRAIAKKLTAEGASVAVIDFNAEAGEETVQQLNEAGGNAKFFYLDVTHTSEIADAFAAVNERYGKIDILVNNAGGDGTMHNIIDTTEEEYDFLMARNTKAYYFAIQKAYPYLKESEHAAVVNISSVASENVQGDYMAPYMVSKAAVNGITRAAAKTLGMAGIRINAVLPTATMTEAEKEFGKNMFGSTEAYVESMRDLYFTGRPNEPEDVAGPVAFLCSDDAAQITAQCILIDAGQNVNMNV